MYPIGFLFGLGFDTATEIGVLGVSAAQASHGLPLATIMVFPALFTAGMALIDTLDAIMMAGAYRWAISEPLRKLHYNLAITLASVVVAAGIGTVELLGLAAGEQPSGGFSQLVAGLNDNLTLIGASIVALFGLSWAISVAATRVAPAHSAEVAAGSAARARLSPRFWLARYF
jgi:high-affinity nickel-transport protein